MRVLALTNLYPNPFQPNRAPFNRHRLRLLGERHPVRVIAPIAWTDELRARWRGQCGLPWSRQIIRDGLTVDYPRYFFPPKVMRKWLGRFYLKSVRATFQRVAAEFKPDILFAPWAYPDGWAAVRLGRQSGLPVVIQVHGSDVLLLDQFPSRRRPTEEALRNADGVVAVSRDLGDRLVRMGVHPGRVHVNYDGVDTSMFHPGGKAEARSRLAIANGEPLLLFIGNLVPVKGVDILLQACGELLDQGFPVRLDIIGEGPLRGVLTQQVEQRKLTGRVRFLGSLANEQLPDRFRAADLFVLPSLSEGVPTVLLEASACDVPWVASRVGGIPEIVGWGRGRLVVAGDSTELARAIRESLSSPPKAPEPEKRPKDRTESVADLSAFLKSVLFKAESDRAPV